MGQLLHDPLLVPIAIEILIAIVNKIFIIIIVFFWQEVGGELARLHFVVNVKCKWVLKIYLFSRPAGHEYSKRRFILSLEELL